MIKPFPTRSLCFLLLVLGLILKISGCGSGGVGPKPNEGPSDAASTPSSPLILSTLPATGATQVAVDTSIRATFSEEMDPATVTPATFSVQTGSQRVAGKIRAEGTVATFTPSAPLASSSTYRVTITTGAKSLSGAVVARNFSWEFTTAVAADTRPPAVLKTIPLNGAANVALNSVISATFSEEVAFPSGAGALRLEAEGTAVAGTVQVNGKTALFAPASALRRDTAYTATITTDIKDLSGNPLASNHVWSFRTGSSADTARPVILSTQPADQATEVSVDRPILVIFNEPMDVSSLNASNLFMSANGTAVPGRISYSGTTAMFIPLEKLQHDTTYQATVTTGARDAAGNLLAAERAWRFTTERLGNALPPEVLSTRPGEGRTGVGIRDAVSARFNHAIDPATLTPQSFFLLKDGEAARIAGSVTYDYNTHSAYFIPQDPLSASTVYRATLTTAVRDPSGKSLSSDHAWRFTTERREALLAAAPSTLTFMATPGGSPPPAQSLVLSQKSAGNIRWTLSTDLAWLNLAPASGSGPASVSASVSTTALAPGTYEGSVTIAAEGGTADPKKIPVRYTLASSAACLGRTRTPYVAFVTAESATLGWECAPQGTVEWGEAPSLTRRREVGPENGNKHFAILSDLTPNTTYAYRVSAQGEILGSGTFQTAAPPGENNFSFVIFGDSGEGTSAQRAIASVMARLDFSFAIIVGDVIYDGGYETEFDPNYFAPYKGLINHLPFFPVVGNHDLVADRGETFKQNFFHPPGTLYYDFYWGDTHFIAINSTYSDDPAQRAWLDRTLAGSVGRWKIVYFHHPPYNSGIFGNNPYIQRDFVPILEKYQVDVVFTGHAHSYERTFPINRITYFVTGGGGAGLTPIEKSDFTAYADSVYHLLLAEMNGDTLTVKAIDRNGALFDSVVITKSE